MVRMGDKVHMKAVKGAMGEVIYINRRHLYCTVETRIPNWDPYQPDYRIRESFKLGVKRKC